MALKERKHIPQGRLAPLRKHSKAFEEENIQQQSEKGAIFYLSLHTLGFQI